jgi:hypothetical protein
MSYNFIPLPATTSLLCSIVDCPISKGTLTKSFVYPIPSGLAGSFQVQMTWETLDGVQLLCISIRSKVVKNNELRLYKSYRYL